MYVNMKYLEKKGQYERCESKELSYKYMTIARIVCFWKLVQLSGSRGSEVG
jgi:hypothetical protein